MKNKSQCGTWAPHGQHGWYVGPAPKHYRCYQIYIKKQGTRICDTVDFFPTNCSLPKVSSHDAAIYTANDLITALTKPQPPNPFLSIGDEQIAALQKLADIFKTTSTKQSISTPGCQALSHPIIHKHAGKPNSAPMLPLQHHQPQTIKKRR